jgi:tRNA isopentenyl-2-thiomethyl-A-37 hydroxylase MiaE
MAYKHTRNPGIVEEKINIEVAKMLLNFIIPYKTNTNIIKYMMVMVNIELSTCELMKNTAKKHKPMSMPRIFSSNFNRLLLSSLLFPTLK